MSATGFWAATTSSFSSPGGAMNSKKLSAGSETGFSGFHHGRLLSLAGQEEDLLLARSDVEDVDVRFGQWLDGQPDAVADLERVGLRVDDLLDRLVTGLLVEQDLVLEGDDLRGGDLVADQLGDVFALAFVEGGVAEVAEADRVLRHGSAGGQERREPDNRYREGEPEVARTSHSRFSEIAMEGRRS